MRHAEVPVQIFIRLCRLRSGRITFGAQMPFELLLRIFVLACASIAHDVIKQARCARRTTMQRIEAITRLEARMQKHAA